MYQIDAVQPVDMFWDDGARGDGGIDNEGESVGGWKAQYSSHLCVFMFEIGV